MGDPAPGQPGVMGARAHALRIAKPTAVLVVAIAIWQAVVGLHLIPSFELAAPTTVAAFIGAHFGTLLSNAGTTVVEVLIAFAVSFSGGVAMAVIITEIKWVEESVLPLLVVSQVIPSIAIAPLLVLMFGFGETPKIVTAIIVSFFPTLISSIMGIRSVSRDARSLSRSLRCSRWQTLRYFTLPTALPAMFAGARVSVTLSVIGAVVGEFVTANHGLGYLVVLGSSSGNPALLFAALTFLAAMGIILFTLVRVAEHYLVPWNG